MAGPPNPCGRQLSGRKGCSSESRDLWPDTPSPSTQLLVPELRGDDGSVAEVVAVDVEEVLEETCARRRGSSAIRGDDRIQGWSGK